MENTAAKMTQDIQTLKNNLQSINDATMTDYIQKYGRDLFIDTSLIDSIILKNSQDIESKTIEHGKDYNALETGVFVWVFIVFGFGFLFLAMDWIALIKNMPRLSLVNGILSFFFIAVSIILMAMKHG